MGVDIEFGMGLKLGVSLHDSGEHTEQLYNQLLVLGMGEGFASAFDQMSKIRLAAEKVKYKLLFNLSLTVMWA